MATVIQIKRSSGTAAPSTLKLGELAYTFGTGTQGNLGDRIFIGEGGVDGNGDANNVTVIGGQYFTDQLDHVAGTLTASSALLVDSNKAIDEIFVGNNATTGGGIKFNEGTNNGSNFIALKSPNAVTTSTTFTLPSGDGSNGQFLKTDGSGNLSFGTVTQTLSIAADSGSNDSVNTGETITFAGDTGLTTTVSDNNISIDLDDTAVTAGSYGSATAIPTFTVDQQGRLTAAGTASVATSLTIVDESSTATTISLLSDTLKITGGAGITTAVTGDTLSVNLDSNVVTETSTDTLTNKTLDLDANTITGTFAEFNTAVQDATLVDLDDSQTLTNKTINSNANTLHIDLDDLGTFTGTLAEFNSGLQGDSFVSLTGTETLTNKTLTSPTINTSAIEGGTVGNSTPVTILKVDNIQVDTNTISSTNTNGNIVLDPNGSGTVDVNSSRITSVTNPSASSDAATKAYVDSVANGLDVKESVRLATAAALAAVTYNNGNGTLTADANGALTIDGVATVANDRVLIKNQASAVQNGIYKVTTIGSGSAAFVLTRSPDADTAAELTGGTFFFTEEGTANADNGYVATHNGTPTFGSTNITFEQFSGAGQISAGSALSKTGNTIDVEVDDSSIEVNSDALRVKALGITNAMLAGSIATAKLAGSITNAKLSNSTISVAADSGTTNAVDLGDTLTVSGGEGIDSSVSGDTLTITAELATASNKGVASFSSDNFTVSSGAVTVTQLDGGTF
jgi:hypothetical protein